ncbi:hypothetical protein [Pasteuria penetrans]|uniref:hypothetical protein n=1 Tax=Pasteuria penetrans TaxID=86005 RepID=UPI0011EC2DE4|nr:hypothetical protein [Pasteuria penetrans]
MSGGSISTSKGTLVLFRMTRSRKPFTSLRRTKDRVIPVYCERRLKASVPMSDGTSQAGTKGTS